VKVKSSASVLHHRIGTCYGDLAGVANVLKLVLNLPTTVEAALPASPGNVPTGREFLDGTLTRTYEVSTGLRGRIVICRYYPQKTH
jgi:hypothetical protein